MKLHYTLLILLLTVGGIRGVFSQEVVKSKKEREETVGRELGLDREKSARLVAGQEEYRGKISAVLKDTTLRPQQRGAKLKALGEEYRSSLKQILSPAQQEKMAAAVKLRSGTKFQQQRQQIELRVPQKRDRSPSQESNKVKQEN